MSFEVIIVDARHIMDIQQDKFVEFISPLHIKLAQVKSIVR